MGKLITRSIDGERPWSALRTNCSKMAQLLARCWYHLAQVFPQSISSIAHIQSFFIYFNITTPWLRPNCSKKYYHLVFPVSLKHFFLTQYFNLHSFSIIFTMLFIFHIFPYFTINHTHWTTLKTQDNTHSRDLIIWRLAPTRVNFLAGKSTESKKIEKSRQSYPQSLLLTSFLIKIWHWK